MNAVFDSANRRIFAEHFPEIPHRLRHDLGDQPMLSLEALARLGEALPDKSVEYNRGDLPVGIDPDLVPANGMTIGDTIRQIDTCRSWAVLKNIEQVPEYEAMLLSLLGEIKPHIEAKTGRMMRPQGFVFVSSPDAVTPYHFDPEHNILMQLRGSKVLTQFPAGNSRYAPDQTHESYHVGGHRNLVWHESLATGGTKWSMVPGDAVYVPVMAPHHVKNGPEPSLSLSITWRSDWSFAEADARALNGMLRRLGLRPNAPGRFPSRNRTKAYLWRALSRLR
jgi:hypothetical protein